MNELLERITHPALTLGVTLSVAWISVGADDRIPDVASAVREMLDYDASHCDTQCQYCAADPLTHKNTDPSPARGTNTGEKHEECIGSVEHDCWSEHRCRDRSLAAADLRGLVETIPTLPASVLADIGRSEPNLHLNVDRRVAQVLGCGGMVLASVEMTRVQFDDLVASDQ